MNKAVEQEVVAYSPLSGEWHDVTDGENVICCDCGLAHTYEYRIVEEASRIIRRSFRNEAITKGRRQLKKVRQDIKNLKG